MGRASSRGRLPIWTSGVCEGRDADAGPARRSGPHHRLGYPGRRPTGGPKACDQNTVPTAAVSDATEEVLSAPSTPKGRTPWHSMALHHPTPEASLRK